MLDGIADEWDRYTTGANYINRHWVKRERDEGRKTIYPVYTVGSLVFLSVTDSNV